VLQSAVPHNKRTSKSNSAHHPTLITPWKPTKQQLIAAEGKTVRDVIAPRLRVLFCGINPGLYTAAVGHHFARPGNRFWPTLFAAGFTDRLVSPFAERELLENGYGITNVVMRATATADQLTREELRAGGKQLAAKVARYKPAFLAVLGLGAYRAAWERAKATIGRQEETIGGTVVWVLPNPSGLNAHYQARELARLFGELKVAVDRIDSEDGYTLKQLTERKNR
jgi:TDG/mug DNA glycosylase family protein